MSLTDAFVTVIQDEVSVQLLVEIMTAYEPLLLTINC